jgi:amino-acid N-acetyltransferase
MNVRCARVSDAQSICDLVNYYAERGLMLHKSLEDVYEMLREFTVAENDDGRVVGCVATDIFWGDLAEVKSFAVAPELRRRGVGAALLAAAVAGARDIGIKRLFVLTYETAFFERHGFSRIGRDALPEKVWRECIACPKVDCCDEIAMLMRLDSGGDTR